ncbi:MAG: hypothetical protein IT504_04120 [Burkholderiaceae bacterium]|nr:hypothetical protein [Burkholderiaceae bacterium]
MRIAYVYDAVYPYILGGVERRVWELSQRLAKRGHEVHTNGDRYFPEYRSCRCNGEHHHPCRNLVPERGGC